MGKSKLARKEEACMLTFLMGQANLQQQETNHPQTRKRLKWHGGKTGGKWLQGRKSIDRSFGNTHTSTGWAMAQETTAGPPCM